MCVVGAIQPIRELDALTRWHSSFKQEVIYIQGAKFKRGGGGAGCDVFVSIRDKHTLLLELIAHTDVCVCDQCVKHLLSCQIRVGSLTGECSFSIGLVLSLYPLIYQLIK